MGTRYITMVVKEKETKVAQYGQWDGYPDGAGVEILKFLTSEDLQEFRKNLVHVSFLTDKELETINKDTNWKTKYPYLSRDVGAGILDYIDGRELQLVNQEDFTGDSLMCEWAYVIDLDTNTFEVYKGFNKARLPESERFAKYNDVDKGTAIANEYKPVRLVEIYYLDNLPSEEDFLTSFVEEDEE